MEKAKIKIIRFDKVDVIATSGERETETEQVNEPRS